MFLLVLFFFSSCSKDDEIVDSGPLSTPIQPEHFPPAKYTFQQNTYSKKGFELGRKLFFDPILSVDSTISCESCHHQKDAFSDAGLAFSFGVEGRVTDRNSPPIFNLAWNTSFMWDGGINHIEVQPFAPIINPNEMAEDLSNVMEKLRNHPEYPKLFETVFNKSPLDDQQLFWALAQYMGNLVSANSKYDRFLKGKEQLSQNEQSGLAVFRIHCSGCHQEPLMTDNSFHNNGLDADPQDGGRFLITQDDGDLGKFKTPTLRNISLTGPYMHDGRFESLGQVIDHYSEGILNSSTLAPSLQQHVGGIGLTSEEKDDLILFLETLTDYEFVNNPELSE